MILLTVNFLLQCDRCECEPIVGIRWHCTDCPPDIAVDFCDECVDWYVLYTWLKVVELIIKSFCTITGGWRFLSDSKITKKSEIWNIFAVPTIVSSHGLETGDLSFPGPSQHVNKYNNFSYIYTCTKQHRFIGQAQANTTYIFIQKHSFIHKHSYLTYTMHIQTCTFTTLLSFKNKDELSDDLLKIKVPESIPKLDIHTSRTESCVSPLVCYLSAIYHQHSGPLFDAIFALFMFI